MFTLFGILVWSLASVPCGLTFFKMNRIAQGTLRRTIPRTVLVPYVSSSTISTKIALSTVVRRSTTGLTRLQQSRFGNSRFYGSVASDHLELPSKTSPTASESYNHELSPFSSRILPETTALLLISVPTSPRTWPSVIEKSDPVVGAASLDANLRKAQVRILANYTESSGTKYSARLFRPDGTMASLEDFTPESLQSQAFLDMIQGKSGDFKQLDRPEIVVCTHGSRDCRCGDIGGDLVHTLKTLPNAGSSINVSECSHVGGHK